MIVQSLEIKILGFSSRNSFIFVFRFFSTIEQLLKPVLFSGGLRSARSKQTQQKQTIKANNQIVEKETPGNKLQGDQ